MKICSTKNAAVLGALLIVGGGALLPRLSRPAHAQVSPISALPDAPTPGQAPALPRVLNDYRPPAESLARLGSITERLAMGTPENRKLKGLKKILRLPHDEKFPDGVLFIDARMETDADGSPNFRSIDPDSGQRETSLPYPNEDGDAQWLNSEMVPYIVLPLKFYEDMGVQLGDVAAVVWQGKVAYAVFGDEGPEHIIGEGSVALSEALGFDPWEMRDGRKQIVNGIDNNVLMFVFPHSANPDITPQNIKQKTAERAKALFAQLGGNTD